MRCVGVCVNVIGSKLTVVLTGAERNRGQTSKG